MNLRWLWLPCFFYAHLLCAGDESIETIRSLMKTPCDLVEMGTTRERLRMFHEISHRIKLEPDAKRLGVYMMSIDDLPMPEGNVFVINFGYPHVSLFYGKVENGKFTGDKFESWPLYEFKRSGVQKNALALEAGTHYIAYDLPDELIANISKNAEALKDKLRLSCAAGVCEVLRRSGIDLPFFAIPEKMVRYIQGNALSAAGQELDFEVFKTDPRPFSEYLKFAREQLKKDGMESLKKRIAAGGGKVNGYMAKLYFYLIRGPSKSILGLFGTEGFEKEEKPAPSDAGQ